MSLGWTFPTSADLDPTPRTLAHALKTDESSIFVRHMPETYTGPESVVWSRVADLPAAPAPRSLDEATTILERRHAAHPLSGLLESSTGVARHALATGAPFEIAALCARTRAPGGFVRALASALRALGTPESEPALAEEIRALAAIAADGGLFGTHHLTGAESVNVGNRSLAEEARRFDARIRARIGRDEERMTGLLARPRAEALAAHRPPSVPRYLATPAQALLRVSKAPAGSPLWQAALDDLAGQPLVAIKPLCLELLEREPAKPIAADADLDVWRRACHAIASSDRDLSREIAARDRAERQRRDAEAERIAAQARAAMRAWPPAQTPPLERWILAFCLLGVFAVSSLLILDRPSRDPYPFAGWTPLAMPDLDQLFPCRYDDECVGRKLDALVLAADSAGEVALATRAQDAASAIRRGDCAAAERAETGIAPPSSPELEQAWLDAFGALYWRCLVSAPPSGDPGSSSPAPSPGSSSGRRPPR